MHDPMTVAFEIKRPWPKPASKYFPKGRRYWPALVTVWHVDPATGGDDDSCGFSYVRVREVDRLWAHMEAEREWRFWFSDEYASINLLTAGHFEIVTAVLRTVRRRFTGTSWWRPLTARDLSLALGLCSGPSDNILSVVRRAKEGKGGFEDLIRCVLRSYLTKRRPWWRRPRWHVHHWRIQVHPLQDLKRFLFTRCAGCGLRFRWGYAPVTAQWDSDRPRWFRGERDKYHSDCIPSPGRKVAS